jgi:hypothetical protein
MKMLGKNTAWLLNKINIIKRIKIGKMLIINDSENIEGVARGHSMLLLRK